jgi:hypothetical protein
MIFSRTLTFSPSSIEPCSFCLKIGTVELKSPSRRSLHLCPGWFWGRKFRRSQSIGGLDPEGALEVRTAQSLSAQGLCAGPEGRYFTTSATVLKEKGVALGGPIAVLLQRPTASRFDYPLSYSYLSSFETEYAREISFADMILVQIFNDRDFICARPQLGIEDEQGGTTIDWSTQPSAQQQPP